MKKLILILCCVMMCVSFGGCSGSNKTDVEILNRCGRDFLIIDTRGPGFISVDVETKVQYMHFGDGTASRVTVLVDSDGKPILYEGGFLNE